jgi:hypothetical protein
MTLALVAMAMMALVMFAWYMRGADRATQRAEALLSAQLSPIELEQLNSMGALHVQSGLTAGRTYAIPPRGTVTVMQDGQPVMRLCIRPVTLLPGREAVLAHKLHIEANEDDYLRRANVVWRDSHVG